MLADQGSLKIAAHDPERWLQIKKVFQAALELDPDRCHAFLAEARGPDIELRSEVE